MSSMFCTKIYQCKNADWCARDYNPKSDCPECFEQLTNYDRLISKTPEELAKLIAEIADCDECEEMHGFRMCDAAPDKACEDCWAGWLRHEAEEGE